MSNVMYVVKKIGEAAKKVVGKEIKPTQKFYRKDYVRLQYMFWDLNIPENGAELDNKKFEELKNVVQNICEVLNKEGCIDYYVISEYKGANRVRGCWEIDCFREKVKRA